mmetsp:Transcript_7966/g.20513  ORF Transcript_7966/g.20513 Transcript_7966/m.20513 type:complete len:216 (+) Transcript_7966:974-1621(+)
MRRAHGPRLKIVAMLRNPADRLWSAYFSYAQFRGQYGEGEAGMRAYFDEQSAGFNLCVQDYDRRTCAMRLESLGQKFQEIFYHCDQLVKTMYSVFVEEYILAFGRPQLLLLRSEDYMDPAKTSGAVLTVLDFVGVRVELSEVDTALAKKMKSPDKRGKLAANHPRSWTMSVALRADMSAFYRPFNEDLARMSGDPAFADWPVLRPTTPVGEAHRR